MSCPPDTLQHRRLNGLLLRLLGCLALLAPLQLQAEQAGSLEEMQAQGHLSIGTTLHPQDGLVPGQKAELILEIAIDTWFTGGTQIGIPEVAGLVILQTEQFASNASESRNGQNWVIQRWSLDVYPQGVGRFTIPSLPIALKVSSGSSKQLTGSIQSTSVSFTVGLPPALQEIEHWVASPQFSVTQQFDKSLDELSAGDAFERTISFNAADVMAMMLPTFTEAKQTGLAAYPAPPVLNNNNNRGVTLASRTQTISYVAEAPGNYVLPAQDYFWWNTEQQALSVLTLPASSVTVKGTAATSGGKAAQILDQPLHLAGITAVLLGLLTLLWLGFHYRLGHKLWVCSNSLRGSIVLLWQSLLELRKPGLPAHLNPDCDPPREQPLKN